MPTVGERLATLEQIAKENSARLETVTDLLNGGDGLPYERSVRGRLHLIESSLAATVLRRSAGLHMLKGWQSAILLLAAVGTVAASWYAALTH